MGDFGFILGILGAWALFGTVGFADLPARVAGVAPGWAVTAVGLGLFLWLLRKVCSIPTSRLATRLDGGAYPSFFAPSRGDDGRGRSLYVDSSFPNFGVEPSDNDDDCMGWWCYDSLAGPDCMSAETTLRGFWLTLLSLKSLIW